MSTTLLTLTQQILSSMDSDEVNSIEDTTEAKQVADCIKEVYEEIVTEYDLRSSKKLFQLENLGDPTKPTILKVPAGYHSIEWIRYNIREDNSGSRDEWVNLVYFDPVTFTSMQQSLDTTASNVVLVPVLPNIEVPCRTDGGPTCYTIYDDEYVVFDSYDSSIDTTLVGEKTNCYGTGPAELLVDDETIIDLPARLINFLRNEARSRAFDLWKDGSTPKIEQAAMRSRVRLQRVRYVERLTDQEKKPLPNYGRK